MKIDFAREREWWDAKAPKEENDTADEAVNRALRWRELERRLDGVRTILDVGGGTGAYSIPLARRGFRVTHLDLSPAMLEIARRKAGGLDTIEFVEANAVDLSRFADRSFDLVLNMDGAISFCGSEAERAISESCRVAARRAILTVSNRALMSAVVAQASIQVTGGFVPAVYEMMERGGWHQDQFPENPLMSKGMTQDYMGAFRAFLPQELEVLLSDSGMRILRLTAVGSLALLVGREAVNTALADDGLREQFLDLCERFDLEIMPHGPGTRQRAGLLAVAER